MAQKDWFNDCLPLLLQPRTMPTSSLWELSRCESRFPWDSGLTFYEHRMLIGTRGYLVANSSASGLSGAFQISMIALRISSFASDQVGDTQMHGISHHQSQT